MIRYFTIRKRNEKRIKKRVLNERWNKVLWSISVVFTLFMVRKAVSEGDAKP